MSDMTGSSSHTGGDATRATSMSGEIPEISITSDGSDNKAITHDTISADSKFKKLEGSFPALGLLEKVDSWLYLEKDAVIYHKELDNYHYFMVEGYEKPIGYIHNEAVHAMEWSPAWEVKAPYLRLRGIDALERTAAIQETLLSNARRGLYGIKIRNEDVSVKDPSNEIIFTMDRSGVELFGVVFHGVHMIGYVRTDQGLKYWIPVRSKTKDDEPGLLDSFVAGSIQAGEKPLEALVREAHEEAGIQPEYTKKHAKDFGTVTYATTWEHAGHKGCQYNCQYVYEIELPEDMTPAPNDGEVEMFKKMSLDEVKEAFQNGEFAPSRAMTYISHFVRSNILNEKNEPRMEEICLHLERKDGLFLV